MQSDEHDRRILARLSRPIERFRSALALTAEQVRGLLDEAGVDARDELPDRSRDLGSFAAGRIDSDRFSVLLESKPHTQVAEASLLKRSFNLLNELLDRGPDLLDVRVERGANLVTAVRRALSEVGRAFGAARLVSPLTPDDERDPALLEGLGYERWSRAERDLAPPLLVHVDGADLHADGLAAFLDGSLKLVLVARDEGPCAPLARLITPGTFVLQDHDDARLGALAAWRGPGIAALLPEGSARFIHDPAGGPELSDRLQVDELPAEPPRSGCGARSPRQQIEELRQLAALANLPGSTGGTPAGAANADPVGALAAWLLSRADLTELDADS